MLPLDDGGRRTKHVAGNVICIYVLCGQVVGLIRHRNRPLFPKTLSIPSYDIGVYVGLRTYQFRANFKYPKVWVYVYCSTLLVFTPLGSTSDTNLTFDVTVTTNTERLNEHYEVHVFVSIGVLHTAAIIWFCITECSSTCWHSPPRSVRRRGHTDWICVHSATH